MVVLIGSTKTWEEKEKNWFEALQTKIHKFVSNEAILTTSFGQWVEKLLLFMCANPQVP